MWLAGDPRIRSRYVVSTTTGGAADDSLGGVDTALQPLPLAADAPATASLLAMVRRYPPTPRTHVDAGQHDRWVVAT